MPRSLFCLSEASCCCRAPLIYLIVTKLVTVNSFIHVNSSSLMEVLDCRCWVWCVQLLPEHDNAEWKLLTVVTFTNPDLRPFETDRSFFWLIRVLLTSNQYSQFFLYICLHVNMSLLMCLPCDSPPTMIAASVEHGPHSFAVVELAFMNNM